VNVDRPGVERTLLREPGPQTVRPIFWKDDLLYYGAARSGADARIWTIRTNNPDRPELAASADPGATAQARIDPTGRWLAYTVNVTDTRDPRAAVFVRPWPSGQARSQIASEGSLPRWRADGGELFFLAPDGRLMAAPVQEDGAIGPPVPLCPTQALATSGLAGDSYDVAADGQRFLVKVPAHRPSIVVMSGWVPGGTR
jgi:hypothetical protein